MFAFLLLHKIRFETVFPRPISSASKALPEDFSKKSSPSFWKFSNFSPELFTSFCAIEFYVFIGGKDGFGGISFDNFFSAKQILIVFLMDIYPSWLLIA